MARSVDVLADVLDDTGTWQRVVLRVSPHDGYFQSLRDLDYLGKVEFVSGGLVGKRAHSDCGRGEDEAFLEWVGRMKTRLKGN